MLPDSIIGRARDARNALVCRSGRRFIRLEEIDYRSLLKKPDPPDSPQFQAELQEVRRLANSHRRRKWSMPPTRRLSGRTFCAGPRPHFNSHVLPRTFAFLQELMWADAAVVEPIKDFYARKRPYEIDPQLTPRIELEDHRLSQWPYGTAAHPCKHAGGNLSGPEGIAVPSCRGDSRRRVKVGMHFPSDIEAGRILGEFIYSRMRRNRCFQSRLIKAERDAAPRVIGASC